LAGPGRLFGTNADGGIRAIAHHIGSAFIPHRPSQHVQRSQRRRLASRVFWGIMADTKWAELLNQARGLSDSELDHLARVNNASRDRCEQCLWCAAVAVRTERIKASARAHLGEFINQHNRRRR
jgi:hypothetical protein